MVIACGAAAGEAAPGAVEIGTPTDYPPGTISDRFAKSHKFFVVREADRIVAVSDICTHKGCALRVDGRQLYCKCHKSAFEPAGTVIKGPAKKSLPRYQITLAAETNVLTVDPAVKFEEASWEDPKAFVQVAE